MSLSNPNGLTYRVFSLWKIVRTWEMFDLIRFLKIREYVSWSSLSLSLIANTLWVYIYIYIHTYTCFIYTFILYMYFTYMYIYFHIYVHISMFYTFLKFGTSAYLEFSFTYFTCLNYWAISLFFIPILQEKSMLKYLEQCLHYCVPLLLSPAWAVCETHRDAMLYISLSSVEKYNKNPGWLQCSNNIETT